MESTPIIDFQSCHPSVSTHCEHDGARQYLPRTVQSRDLSPICLSYVQFIGHHPTLLSHPRWRCQQQHKHYNQLLNGLKTASSQPSHVGSVVDYSHLFLTDRFFCADGNDRDKIRVTTNEKTGIVLECMRKIRLGDLNIYSPKRDADWRVSVNLEVPST